MAQVTNFSSETIVVTWEEAGERHAIDLKSGQQTIPAIDIDAVNGGSTPIFSKDDWWSVPSTSGGFAHQFEAVVYDEGFFFGNLSLHCFSQAAPPTEPYGHDLPHPYQHLGEKPEWDELARKKAGSYIVATPPSQKGIYSSENEDYEYEDGEYDRWFSIFGNYVQTRNFITVRLKLSGESELHRRHASDLTQVGPAVSLDELKKEWKQRIREIWNDGAVPAPPGSPDHLRIDVEWVEEDPHCRVDVADWTPLTKEEVNEGKKKSFWNRANMFRWVSDMDGTGPNIRNVSAHEVGHYLGLIDSYMYDGEVWLFEDEIKAHANTPDSTLKLSKKTAEFWLAIPVWITGRAQTRKENGKFTTDADLLETSSSKLLIPDLIDSIARRKEQTLKWHPRQWERKDFTLH